MESWKDSEYGAKGAALEASTRNSVKATPEEVPYTTGSEALNDMGVPTPTFKYAAAMYDEPATVNSVAGGDQSSALTKIPNKEAIFVSGTLIFLLNVSRICPSSLTQPVPEKYS